MFDFRDFTESNIQAKLEDNNVNDVDTDDPKVTERFEEMLNEVYDFSCVGGPFAHMSPAKVLEEMDPTDYRIGLVEHMDYMEESGEVIRIGPCYYWPDDVEEALDELEDEQEEEDEE